ncbi:hypothetical protein B9T35_17365 [Acinetobacter sp. ANC 3832]|nr:hypothetical protein B9T35_17365 [Acinetobacter sp. ANC 3832]
MAKGQRDVVKLFLRLTRLVAPALIHHLTSWWYNNSERHFQCDAEKRLFDALGQSAVLDLKVKD